MAKTLPRIQLDPEVHKLIESAAKIAGVSNQAVVAQAVRQLILNQDAAGMLRDVAVHSTAQLVELAAKIDAIFDFISDRYAVDLADADLEQD